jgi:hypothetical protein
MILKLSELMSISHRAVVENAVKLLFDRVSSRIKRGEGLW